MKRRAHFIQIYKKLGLPESASLEDLRQRYHHLASIYHPDKAAQGGPPAANIELFQETNAAYQELKLYHKNHGHLPLSPHQIVIFPSNVTTEIKTHIHRHSRWPLVPFTILVISLIFIIFYNPSQNQTTPATSHKDPVHSDSPLFPNDQTPTSSRSISSASPINASDQPLRLGMSIGETFGLLGIPDDIVGDQWFYGLSEVYFVDGRVSGWSNNPKSPINTDPNLPQRYIPTHSQH